MWKAYEKVSVLEDCNNKNAKEMLEKLKQGELGYSVIMKRLLLCKKIINQIKFTGGSDENGCSKNYYLKKHGQDQFNGDWLVTIFGIVN